MQLLAGLRMNAARAVVYDTVLLITLLCIGFAVLCVLAAWLEGRGR